MTPKNKISNLPFRLSSLHLVQLTLFVWGCIASGAFAQTRFTRTTFNAAYTPITSGGGATSSTATGDNVNQTGIPIGFNFGYADSTFTTVGLSTNGVVWFDAIAPAVTVGHANIIATSAPNQTLAPWCNNLIDDASSEILYQTQGSPGSRTFTVQYTNYPSYTGTPGSNVRMNCQVILHETTNVIEFCYGTLNIIGGQTTSGGAMIGMEWGTGGNGNFIDAVTGSSIVSHKMLSPLSGWPSYNFRFTPGTPSVIPAGTYNVGIGQTYNSLTQAIADVNHRGITGAVTLNLTDAQYDTTAGNGSNIFPIFVATPNSSATNLLTISKTGSPATLAYRGSSITAGSFGTGVGTSVISDSEEPILGVCASYTTISNLNLITHGAPQTVEIGLAVFELFVNQGAQNNLFDKISVDLDRTHGGVYGISSFSTTSPGGFAGTNSNNTFRDLNIKDCNFGFSLEGVNNATGPADQGNKIITSSCNTFNYIGDPNVPNDISSTSTVYGINVTGQFNFTISNCVIQNLSTTNSGSKLTGIAIANSYGTNEISNNIIRTLKRNNTAASSVSIIAGISISYGNQVMTYKIFNNSISNFLMSYTGVATATRFVKGIYFSDTGAGTVTGEIWNNSISIDGSTFPNASTTCMEFADNDKTMLIKNNVFANFTIAQTGLATHYCFVTPTADRYGNISSLSDYNNIYIANAANGYIGRGATTDYSTLAAWQAGMSFNTGTDANSVSSDPFFTNNANDLHGTSSSTAIDGTGTIPAAYITTDFDCQTRNAPHDIGFDDFTPGCPANGGTIAPALAGICAQTTYTMTSTGFGTGPNNTYQWMVSATNGGPYSNVTGGTGETTSSYTTAHLSAGTYYYVMKATCADGGFDFSNQLKIIVHGLPNATVTAGGSTTFCSGGSVLLNAVIAANRSYQWKKSGNNISGAISSSYTATSSGNYKVVVTNTASGCTKLSPTAIAVTSNPLPAATITASGPLSFCAGDSVVLQANTGAGLTYKWKKNGTYIPGATASDYTAKISGTYKVVVKNSNTCSKLSAGIIVSVTCRDGNMISSENIMDFNVYPNPSSGEFAIEFSNKPEHLVQVEMTDVFGKLVKKFETNDETFVIKESNLARGLYILKINSEGMNQNRKLIIE